MGNKSAEMAIGIGEELPQCGQWRLLREIGRGAYGVVYLAKDGDGAKAAVKVCRRGDMPPELYEREARGAKLYASIPRTAGLVQAYGLAEEPWGFYFAMALADDEFGRDAPADADYRPKTLAAVIDGEKALPLGECVKLGIALAKGLAELQRRHFLHRDIKPGNVIYIGGEPVLSDPGLVVEEAVAVSTVGTPGYVPPERKFTSSASDIFSLGMTLKAASFGRRIEDLGKGPALEADTGAKHFPAWWRILNKATDPVPSRRHQSAKAFLKDLRMLRARMALPAMSVILAVAAAAVLAFALYCAISVKTKVEDKERAMQSYIEREKQKGLRAADAAKRDIDRVLKSLNIN